MVLSSTREAGDGQAVSPMNNSEAIVVLRCWQIFLTIPYQLETNCL